ncbi:MAG: hypothetical protein WED00_08835 [Aquisalimonadaceae bacterium]
MSSETPDSSKPLDGKKQGLSYETWALCDLWTLPEAISLLLADKLRIPGQAAELETASHEGKLIEAVARRCAGASLPIVRSAAFPDSLCVRPQEFLDWAELKTLDVPGELRRAIDEVAPATGGGKPEKQLRTSQRHREMCRGIASLLWQDNPTMTIEAMAQRSEIRETGCEGTDYGHETLRNWIKVKAPNRAPGRRPVAPKTPI